jgi:membrane-associated phospholipid phosphatase
MFWHLITRLGEVQILLPAALLAAWVLVARRDNWRTAAIWLCCLGLAIALTLASKLAFIGWGLGLPAFNFSGVSGHAMMSAAMYPVLLATLVPARSAAGRWAAFGFGVGLALLVGVSRVQVGAHSWSEVVAGLAVGGTVTVLVLVAQGLPRGLPRLSMATSVAVPLAIAVWLTVMPAFGPAFNSHSVVTQWSLRLSGRPAPYTRSEMLREYRQRAAQEAGSA